MAQRKSLKVSLVRSVLCAVLCLGLLVGTTFAWFSDEAKTAETTITAGNLDVDIETPEGESLNGVSIFDEALDSFLWEPGAMFASKEFVVSNKGNLALKFLLKMNIEDGETVQLDDGSVLKLSDVVQMKVVNTKKDTTPAPEAPEATQEQRREYWNSITGEVLAHEGVIYPTGNTKGEEELGANEFNEKTDALQVVLYWEPTDSTAVDPSVNPDNKYNINNGQEGSLSATFSLDVFATQATYESDSFGNMYDDGIIVDNVTEAGDLRDALNNGASDVSMGGDITNGGLSGLSMSPGQELNGNGHTLTLSSRAGIMVNGGSETDPTVIENLVIAGSDGGATSAISVTGGTVIIRNVTADVSCEGEGLHGIVIKGGANVTIENCTVTAYVALQVRDGSKVTVKNSRLIGYNQHDINRDNDGVIRLDSTLAADSVTFEHCAIERKWDTPYKANAHIFVEDMTDEDDLLPDDETKAKEILDGILYGGIEGLLADNVILDNGVPCGEGQFKLLWDTKIG